MMDKLRNMDKKILAMLIFIIVVILVLVFALIILSLTTGGKMSYTKVEQTMVRAAKKYYKDNPSLLPKAYGKDSEVDDTTLASGGYMKDLSTYTDGKSCTGKVIVGKTKTDYDYVAYLDCGDSYQTALFYKILIDKKVDSGEGLYAVEDFITTDYNLDIDEDGYDLSTNELLKGYVFRGQRVDNYVSINKATYRIVKIDGNNDIMIVQDKINNTAYFDNRYNSETEKNSGINDFSVSRVYDTARDYYETKIINDNPIRTKGVPKSICVGARSEDESRTDGSVECSKVLKDTYIGLLSVYDVMNASLSSECSSTTDPNCGNYNYLTEIGEFWTVTPNDDNSYTEYKVTKNKGIVSSETKYSSGYRYTFYLSNKVIYVSGSGTKTDPYIIK